MQCAAVAAGYYVHHQPTHLIVLHFVSQIEGVVDMSDGGVGVALFLTTRGAV
jgi:hypothetical protein